MYYNIIRPSKKNNKNQDNFFKKNLNELIVTSSI